MVTHKFHATSPPAIDNPKRSAAATSPRGELEVKNERIPIINEPFKIIRILKKSMVSNSLPHIQLPPKRAREGSTDTNNAILPSLRLTPYLGLARYSIRSGNIISVPNPNNIQEIIVCRNIVSCARKLKPCSSAVSCEDKLLSEPFEIGIKETHHALKKREAAKITSRIGYR